jgi:ABC-type multidrug transport system ATPase subunit
MRERVLLREVSFELDSGELVAVWGVRRSGRTTLLRVAAGIEPPDAGTVRFAGRELARAGGDLLGRQIAFCPHGCGPSESSSVLDELVGAQLARGIPHASAHGRAWATLERVGAQDCAQYSTRELDSAECVRVSLARGLLSDPSLLVIDEPINGIDLLERDSILALLRSLADDGTALLMSTGDAAALAVADRALSLSEGELRGTLNPELACVVPLPRRASA